jgi:hypothetical protein
MSPCIGPKDCGIARRCKLFLGTEFERGALVLEDPSVWPPLECPREFAAANLNAESYLEREHNARWAAFGLALVAPHGPSTVCKRLFRKEILVGAVGIEN